MCRTEKVESDFVSPKHPNYGSRYCAECREVRLARRETAQKNIKQSMANWRARNRDKTNRNQILKKFDLTEEQYRGLIEKQKGCCAICDNKVSLCVDHCHSTGKIRGLLCRPCNTAIGMFKENPYVIERAMEYCMAGGIL